LRILLLSDVNSSHTQKWAISLAGQGIEVGIFSLGELTTDRYTGIDNVKIFVNKSASRTFKISYLQALPGLKQVIKEFKPDVVHAHYATSYGLLGALSGFHPFIISLWGSDVYGFPNKSFLHKYLLRHNLKKADRILSTSKAMAIEAAKYTAKNITVIPFGIDVSVFKPSQPLSVFRSDDMVVGTIKMLETLYGIEYLIKAFHLVKKRNAQIRLKLLIVGGGSLSVELKNLVKGLGIEEDVHFTGLVDHKEISTYHNSIAITVFPSLQESFGVSVLEASACEKPVIVTNVGGLPEVVENGVTGIIIPPADYNKLADAIEKLVLNEELRKQMGKKGRERVEALYNWHNNVKQMIAVYQQAVNKG